MNKGWKLESNKKKALRAAADSDIFIQLNDTLRPKPTPPAFACLTKMGSTMFHQSAKRNC